MGKFEVELELTGLKLRVKGDSSQDMPRIAQQLGQQVAGLIQPAANIIEPDAGPLFKQIESQSRPVAPEDGQKKRKGRSGPRRAGVNGDQPAQPLPEWQHDPGKWGTPKQGWTAGQKITWLLYVISKETGQTEVGGPTIAEVFGAKFKQFGPLKKANMPRDLGALKTKQPHAWVMDNETKSPITWYLTEEGMREAEKIVAEAKGGSPPAGS